MGIKSMMGNKIKQKFESDAGIIVSKLNEMINAMKQLNDKMIEITDNQVEGEEYFNKIIKKLEK